MYGGLGVAIAPPDLRGDRPNPDEVNAPPGFGRGILPYCDAAFIKLAGTN